MNDEPQTGSPGTEPFTRLLRDVEADRPGALDELMTSVYDDLRRMAERHMDARFGRDLPGVTLEPSALVHESFLRLIKQRNRYDNRGHFFAIATKVMLRVLTDYQRHRGAAKRGAGVKPLTLSMEVADDAEPGGRPDGRPKTTIAVGTLAGALEKLDALDPRKADVVRLRVIWGLRMQEVAESLDVSLATVERDWAFAKAWLTREAARGD